MQRAEKQASKVDEIQRQKQTAEKIQSQLALAEAALYVAGRPLDLKELCSILKTRSQNKVRKLLKTLLQEYAGRNTALEILELKDERYVLQLKVEYAPTVRRLVKRPLLSTGPLKTLSYIAFRQPVSRKRVVEVRGRHAYGHIKLLREMGLVASERKGRSVTLRTTEYFADYFGLSHDMTLLKRELKTVFKGEIPTEEKKRET